VSEQISFVEVRDEPRHRHRFENDFVRVYDVLIPPGDTTLYHRHTEDTLYVAIAPASVADQTLGDDKVRSFDIPVGLSLCRDHRDRPLTHQVNNVGKTDMRMIGVEVKTSPGQVTSQPLSGDCVEMKWEAERMRGYDVLIPVAGSLELDQDVIGVLVLVTAGCLDFSQTDSDQRSASLAAGDVIWQSWQAGQRIVNLGDEEVRAVIAQWC
jgi:hypothetical protein